MSLTSAAERTVAVAELVCTCLASAVYLGRSGPSACKDLGTTDGPDLAATLVYTVYLIRHLLCMYEVSTVYVLYPSVCWSNSSQHQKFPPLTRQESPAWVIFSAYEIIVWQTMG
jgi:hypothetical protein